MSLKTKIKIMCDTSIRAILRIAALKNNEICNLLSKSAQGKFIPALKNAACS